MWPSAFAASPETGMLRLQRALCHSLAVLAPAPGVDQGQNQQVELGPGFLCHGAHGGGEGTHLLLA